MKREKNEMKKEKKKFLPWTEFIDECVCILLLCLKTDFLSETIN